jgi:hypothetical protein
VPEPDHKGRRRAEDETEPGNSSLDPRLARGTTYVLAYTFLTGQSRPLNTFVVEATESLRIATI